MPIPLEAQEIIAKAIYRNSVMASLFIKKEQLTLIVAAIETDLEEAGFVVVQATELGFPVPEGPNP
jgi:hypothetical protein